MQNVSATDEIITQKKGSVGLICLNRPKAINSLNEAMVSGMKAGLDLFARDEDVTSVVLCGEGERGLCAGGDVRLIYEGRSADEAGRTRFWREEFPLNERISNYPKPRSGSTSRRPSSRWSKRSASDRPAGTAAMDHRSTRAA